MLTDVPENAVFTDTVTRINNKTGDITKEDIMALGIPGQDTVTTVNGKTGPITKADIMALGISEGGGTDIEIVDNLETEAADKALSAKQGKALNSQISEIANQKGEPDGIATLDETGKVPLAQLPEGTGVAGVDELARDAIDDITDQGFIKGFMVLTQAEYDVLGTKDETVYLLKIKC